MNPLIAESPTAAETVTWPYAAELALQILGLGFLAFILLFVAGHWAFHSWSFTNILRLAAGYRLAEPSRKSYRYMPALAVLIWVLYTLYVLIFVYVAVALLQAKPLYAKVIGTGLLGQQRVLEPLVYLLFGLALFPVVVNMVAAIIKLTMDARYAAKVRQTRSADETASQGSGSDADGRQVEGSGTPLPGPEEIHSPLTPSVQANAAASQQPMVYMMIPVYNEPLPNLIGALNGVAASDYPRLKVFVGFDKLDVEETFFAMCRILSGTPVVGDEVLTAIERRSSRLFPSPSRLSLMGDLKYNGLHQIAKQSSASTRSQTASPATTLGRLSVSRNVSSTSLLSMGGAHVPTDGGVPDMSVETLPASRRSSHNDNLSDGENAVHSPPLLARSGSLAARSRVSTLGSNTTANNPTMFSHDACPTEFTVTYRGVEFTIYRFEHSGKLGTQRNMFGKLRERLASQADEESGETVVLFMDSDTFIQGDAISQLVGELNRYPSSKACTGFCVSRNEGSWSFWRILQDAEYIESMIYRNAESLLGSVTCLPGVLTMFRWSTLCEVSSDYFDQAPIDTTFEFARRYLGEDRYMSHLLMCRYSWRSLGFSSAAVCKTEAPSTFYNLLRQRRRWYLGQVSNELIMLCTPDLWSKFPLLLFTKFLMMLKIGGSLVYLVVFELLFEAVFSPSRFSWPLFWWLALIAAPNWLFIAVWCAMTRRLKSAILFPLYYWINPLFMVIVLLYSIATVNERTWGGPRAAASSSSAAGDTANSHRKTDNDEEVNLEG